MMSELRCPSCGTNVEYDDETERLQARVEQLEAGLKRISQAESGIWGTIAAETLHPERANPKLVRWWAT